MSSGVLTASKAKVADEVFIATALLHRENPRRSDFTVSEIVDRVAKENVSANLRPGVRIHAYLHCVANMKANPGTYRMLYATGKNTRRLLLSTDDVHPSRTGKIFPDPEDIPSRYHKLIDWAKQRYNQGGERSSRWLEGVLKLRGIGRDLWKGEDPDEYVRKLRKGWE